MAEKLPRQVNPKIITKCYNYVKQLENQLKCDTAIYWETLVIIETVIRLLWEVLLNDSEGFPMDHVDECNGEYPLCFHVGQMLVD